MQVDLQIDSMTTANKKQSKNISYVNPEATNAQLKTLAQTLNALTTNIYTDAQRIAENSVNSSDGAKTEPTLSVDEYGAVTYNGDGILSATGNDSSLNDKLFFNVYNNQIRCINSMNPSAFVTSYSGIVCASEGENFAAKSVSFSIGE